MKLIIENCERKLWEWLYLEYKHAAEIWKDNIVFTNVKDNDMFIRLRNLGKVYRESFIEIIDERKAIVLDPLAEKKLCRDDFIGRDYIIIGGILGDRVITGKTREYITKKTKKAIVRNLGKVQLTIDTAALVAKLIYMGLNLDEIQISNEVEIKINEIESIVLPYGYVVFQGKPIITPGLINYLLKKYERNEF